MHDREGGFVVLDSGQYAEKANQAIAKNFIPAEEKKDNNYKNSYYEDTWR